MFFAFDRKKPRGWMIASMSAMLACAMASGVPKRANSSGVTLFTAASVHCADRITAMVKVNGSLWSSEHSPSP